jgi:hypothetical protein
VAGASLALTLARAYLLRPLPYPEAGRLVTVFPAPSRDQFDLIPDLSGVDWDPAARLFETTSAWDLDGFTLVGAGGPPEMVVGSWVSAGFFTLLGIEPASGDSRAIRRGLQCGPDRDGPGAAAGQTLRWSDRRADARDRPPDQDALVTIVACCRRGRGICIASPTPDPERTANVPARHPRVERAPQRVSPPWSAQVSQPTCLADVAIPTQEEYASKPTGAAGTGRRRAAAVAAGSGERRGPAAGARLLPGCAS